MSVSTIVWRRLDVPGMESARLSFRNPGWMLEGTAIFVHGGLPCCLSYVIALSQEWETRSCDITGWTGSSHISTDLRTDASRKWWRDGREIQAVKGCIDIDLNFSPSTNLLPIRRLSLDIGQSADVTAAWLRFPSLKLEPLGQTYRRLTGDTFRYESGGGSFVRDLTTTEDGFVTHYPGFWSAESGS